MTTQISKIQLRRGRQSELPGAANAPLDVGEIAFTTDTNRVFIGADPTPQGSATLVSRVHGAQNPTNGGFPYGNVEILTEFSPLNQAVFDTEARHITSAFLVSTPLAITGSAWATVMVLQILSFEAPAEPVAFVLDAQSAGGLFGCAQISYHIVDQPTGMPLRTGRLSVFFQGHAFGDPWVTDEAVSNPFAGFATGGSAIDPNQRYGLIALRLGPGMTLQYQINLTGGQLPVPVMYFRVEQPQPLPAAPLMGNGSASAMGNTSTTGSTIITINANTALPYDIVGDFLDSFADINVLFTLIFARAVSFTAGLPSSKAHCATPPTGAVSLPLRLKPVGQNEVAIGSLDFAANATTGSFSFPSTIIVRAGDLLSLIPPSPIDPTFGVLSYTLTGTIVP